MDGEVAMNHRQYVSSVTHTGGRMAAMVLTKVCGGDEQLAGYLWTVIRVKVLGRQGDLYETCLPAEKQEALLRCLESARDVPGDVVECGVFRGGGALLMALALQQARSSKCIHAFDSFEGLPEHMPADMLNDGTVHYTKGVFAGTSLRLVQAKLCLFGVSQRVKLYKGFFENTCPQVFKRDERFSLVLIDCDQYRGTKFCLEYFYDRVNAGGMIVVDDYFIPIDHDTPGVKAAADEFVQDRPEHLEHLALSMYGFRKL